MASRLARAINLLIGGLIALTLTVGPLRAAEDQPLSLRYGVYWAGFQVATLALDHRVGPRHYRSELLVQTVGVVEKLAHYRSRILATGWLEADENLAPVSFSSEYRSRKKDRRSMVRFDPASGDVVDLKIMKRGKPDTSKVPAALRKNVIDPLTAFFQLRDYVAGADPSGPFTAAIFDGRRRYDIEATVTGYDRVWVAGRERRAVRVGLTLTMLAGSELDNVELDDNQLGIELVLSDDQRLLPLQMRLTDSRPSASIELLQDCSGEASCQLAAR